MFENYDVGQLEANQSTIIRGMVKNISQNFSNKIMVLYLGLNLGITGICLNLIDSALLSHINIGEIYEFTIDVEIYKQCLTHVNKQFLFLKFSDAQLNLFKEKGDKS